MNEYIVDLMSIDYFSLISAIVIIMGAIIALKELFEKFCGIVGIEFAWIKAKNEMRECQITVKKELADLQDRQDKFEKEHKENIAKRNEFNGQIIESIKEIKTEISELNRSIERREAEKRFEKLRDDIVEFASGLATRETVSSELMENIYRKIGLYESLHEEFGFKNSQAPISIEVIKKKYEDMLLKGQVTKKEEN